MDLSPLRKWEVLGPDAEPLIQRVITRDVRKLAVGQVVYTALCNETGGMIDDATVFRLGQDNFRFVGGDEYDGVWLREVAERERPAGVDQAVHRPAAQPRAAGPAQPRGAGRDRLDAADPAEPGRAQVVPLPGRADRRLRRDPDHRLAHRLHGRARLRDLVPPVRRTGGVGRDLGRRRAARLQAARARGARHPADRVGADLRRLRVRRPGRPVRGRDRVRRGARRRRGLRRARRADRAQGAPAAPAGRPRARGQRGRRPRRRGVRRAPARRRRHQRHPQPDA